jgi:hypothetical protein
VVAQEQQQPEPVPELPPGQLQREQPPEHREQPPEPPNSQEQQQEEPLGRSSRLVPVQLPEPVQASNSCIRPT